MIGILVPEVKEDLIQREYIDKLPIPNGNVAVYKAYMPSKKPKKKDIKQYVTEELDGFLKQDNIEYLLVSEPEYFKYLAKVPNADKNIGYIFKYENVKVLYIPSVSRIFFDPDNVRDKINRTIKTLIQGMKGSYSDPGSSILKKVVYPSGYFEVLDYLDEYLKEDKLTCDIETTSLNYDRAELLTITFCKSVEEGISFKIDKEIEELLKWFFTKYQGTVIWHNIAYDATVLIRRLWMDSLSDTEGLLQGLEVMTKSFEDTKLIAYLATNTCAGNHLGLKDLSQEFAGNYALEEIEDASSIPLDKLLQYNLIDGLSTWYVYNKYYPKMIEDEQLDIYESLFKPATKDIIQMQLTGFPLDSQRVAEVAGLLNKESEDLLIKINKHQIILEFTEILKQKWVDAKNAKLKKKKVTIEDANVEFNPRSSLQLQELLYEFLNLPVLKKTKSNQPATDSDTIAALKNHTAEPAVKELLQLFLDFSAVDKITTAFMPSFLDAPKGGDGWSYLIGSFNLGGTVSGRLSSSKPNLQQLPATGSKYAKIVKSCFKAPPGWVLCGLDFNALEDHISALTTKDPEKLKVYTDGYDGHCLRAFSYFEEKMPDIKKELDEIRKGPNLYKVTLDDGTIRYLQEDNPEFRRLAEEHLEGD